MGNSQEIDKPWWVSYDVIQLINKKEWITDIHNNTDETAKHYAKWKKSYTTEYIPYVSRYVLEQKILIFDLKKNSEERFPERLGCDIQVGWGEGVGGYFFKSRFISS